MKQGWEIKKLGDICCKKQQIARAVKTYSPSDSIVYIDISAIDSSTNEITEPTTMLLKDAPSRAQQVVEKNDILVSLVRPNLKNIALICDDRNNLVASSGFCILRTKENPRFLKYIVIGEPFTNYLISRTSGANYPAVREDDVKGYSIPIPPLPEQEKIVAELDCLSGIIEKKKQQLKELDSLAQSIFYEMFGNPIDNEKGWEVKNMEELFDIGSSKRVFESQWTDNGVPFYRAREIIRLSKGESIGSPIFISEELYNEYSKKYGVPSKGDMMVTAVGTLGVCYIVKSTDRFYFKDGNTLWFKSKGICDTQFIKDEFATDFVVNQIKGNANAAVVGTYTITNAKKTKVIVPPLTLQKEYVNKIETIEKQKELIKQSIAETETLFNSRMDFYFS